MKSGIAIAVSVATLTVAQTVAQSRPFSFEMLTVPASALPEGCALRPTASPSRPVMVSTPTTAAPGVPVERFTVMFREPMAAFASNPFIARERSDVYRVRTAIDGGVGALRVPDGPPLTPAETAAMQMRYVQHVIDGYWAIYTTPQNDSVEVYAIRFDDPSLAETRRPGTFDKPFSTPRPGAAATILSQQIVKGPVVALVRGNTSTRCLGVVRDFVQAVNVK